MTLISADVEHRTFDATVEFTAKARWGICPEIEVRRIARECLAAAVVAQTGLAPAEVDRLLREGVIRVGPVGQTGRVWRATGEVAVRLDTPA